MKITLQRTSPNYRQKLSTTKIMNYLTVGLLVIVAYTLISPMITKGNQGMQYLTKTALIYAVSIGVALITECIWAVTHKIEILEQIKTSFPLVTSIIFALTLPIGTPLYVVAIGSFCAIFLGKLVYGGFGHNIFNPALVGRVIVHLSYGASLTTALPVNGVDLPARATPAAMLNATSWLGSEAFDQAYSLFDLFIGNHAGTLGETCVLLILIVGVVLAFLRVFDARIPVAYLGTVLVLAEVFALVNGLNPLTYPLTHLCIGGVVFGAVIMATDPVTSPSSPLGKIIFGIGLGFLTMIIRLKANYPEGVLFSILIMNMLTPLIDSFVLGRTNQKIGKQIAAIGIALVVVIGCVAGVSVSIKNEVIAAAEEAKKAEEEAAKKKAEEEAKKPKWNVVSKISGGYLMEAYGFGGETNPMKVEVKLNKDKITSVKVKEYAGETAGYGLDLIEGKSATEKGKAFYDKVLKGSMKTSDVAGIDTATGATMTSNGIVNAIKGAIEAYESEPTVKGSVYTYTLTAQGFGGDANPLKVEVSVDKAKQTVTSVKVKEYAGETAGYGLDLIEGKSANEKGKAFYDKVLKGKFSFNDAAGIDTSTGATLTTKGIMDAVNQAIEKVNAILTPNKDGYYEVKASGFGGDANPMTVLVKVKGDKVTVKVKDYAGETAGYGLDLIEGKSTNEKGKAFYNQFLKSSFNKKDISGVDTSTGATLTTKGIVEAIEKAIAAAN